MCYNKMMSLRIDKKMEMDIDEVVITSGRRTRWRDAREVVGVVVVNGVHGQVALPWLPTALNDIR